MTSLLVPDLVRKTCRTCLSTNGEMVSIFSYDLHVKQLPKKLMAFTNVEIYENDGLPKVICKKCVFLADSFYCFKEQCEFAYFQLKSFMKRASNVDDRLKANDDGLNITNENNLKPWSNEAQDSVPENETDYVIEYISEDVKIKVEEALKRRQEAERRISIAKVSQSIRNLEGIEVVPISNVSAAQKAKVTGKTKKQEIVMFPVTMKKKKKKATAGTYEIITIDDTSPMEKKLESFHDTLPSQILRQDLKGDESMVHNKRKKPGFPMVRKMVKIDVNKGLHIEPKDENRETLDSTQHLQETSTEVIILADSQNRQDNMEHLNLEKLDHKVYHPEHERRISQFSHQMLNQENIDFRNEKKENVDISVQSFKDTEDSAVIMEKSTVGCIINAINDKSFKDMNQAEEDIMMSFPNAEDKAQVVISYVIDKRSENSTKSQVIENSEDENVKSIQPPPPSCFELDACKIVNDDEVKPLALLSVDPSRGEDNTATSIKIYQREDSEPPGKVAKKISALTDQYSIPPFFSANRKGSNRNLRFYRCTVCLMNFASMPAVLKHNIDEHMVDDSTFLCLICDKNFEDKSSLSNHISEHNGSKPYKCTFCPKIFTLQRNLKRHVNHHINYKPYQCEICTKKFTEKSSLKSHMFLHTGESPFACKSCNVSFNNKTNWRRHVMTIHEKLTAVVCKFCNKELPNRRSLRVHLRVHTGDKPYQCPHCEKRFTQQCNLNTHIHCHLNDRPFTCPHCGKGFNQRGTRDDHVLTHTGEKRHKCTKCEASFTVSSALKRHMWVHTKKTRPYNCDRCKLQFVGLYDLRRHLRVRHGQLIKPGNPRVARVVIESKRKKEPEDVPEEPIEVDENEAVIFQAIQPTGIPTDCFGLEPTSEENNFSSCNLTKLENDGSDITRQSLAETKIENFIDGTKKEIIRSPDIPSDKDDTELKIRNGVGEEH